MINLMIQKVRTKEIFKYGNMCIDGSFYIKIRNIHIISNIFKVSDIRLDMMFPGDHVHIFIGWNCKFLTDDLNRMISICNFITGRKVSIHYIPYDDNLYGFRRMIWLTPSTKCKWYIFNHDMHIATISHMLNNDWVPRLLISVSKRQHDRENMSIFATLQYSHKSF